MKENDIVHVRAEVTSSVQNADVTTSLFGRQAAVGGPNVATGLPAGFRDERIAGGSDLPSQFQLNTPVTLAFLPDGRLLVTEKGGKLRLVKNNLVQPQAVLDLTAKVSPLGDGGLISVAVDPAFATNGFIYLIYTNPNPREGHLSRFQMSGDTVNPASETVLLITIADHVSHMVDDIRFGPNNTLYASDGDSSPYDTATVYSTRSQEKDQTVGKIYRMTMDGKGLSTNPFWTGNADDPASKVFALGLRNPFRFTVRPDGSVIVGDVGWNSWEEIDRIPVSGGNHNYGWPCYEGGPNGSLVQSAFSNFPICKTLLTKGTSAVTAPSFAYDHTVGSSVIGGPVYDQSVFPTPYKGSYFFGDYSHNWIDYWPLDASGNFVGQPIRFATVANPVDIEMGPDGALYYVSITKGQVRRIAYGTASSCAPGNYLANYYTNRTWSGTPTITRCDDTINNDWGTGGPFGTSPVDNFSVSWSGSQYFTKGINTLSSTSDDGMQVWVDGQLVIDNNGIHPAITKTATLTYATGGFHDVVVKYYEATGQAVAKFSITSANKPPVPQISHPTDGSGFAAHQVITVTGSATDPEDGPLSGGSLQWNVILHHCPPVTPGNTEICHTHPFDTFTGTSGSVTAPDTSGDWIWLEFALTAFDSSGANATTRVNVWPNFCPAGSYWAQYYKNQTWTGTPAIKRCDPTINNNWGTGGPFGASPVDHFSIIWHSRQFFSQGTSKLTATSDDGMQVWVDGQLVIDNNGIHPATTKTATLTYPLAGYHDVLVQYFEATGNAVAQFSIVKQ